MDTLLKMICVRAFKKRISLPEAYFNLTEDSMLLTYHIDRKTRFITVEGRENVAQFLLEHTGKIVDYAGTGKNVRMDRAELYTMVGKNSVPVQLTKISELKWSQITFDRWEVEHLAAVNEYEITGFKTGLSKLKNGLSKGKVVNLFKAA
jgi:hypothetical protein